MAAILQCAQFLRDVMASVNPPTCRCCPILSSWYLEVFTVRGLGLEHFDISPPIGTYCSLMSVTSIQKTNGEQGGVSKSVHDSSIYESVTKRGILKNISFKNAGHGRSANGCNHATPTSASHGYLCSVGNVIANRHASSSLKYRCTCGTATSGI